MTENQEEKKPPDKFMTAQQVAERLSCTERYIYILIQEGILKAIKIGPRAIRVSEQSFIDFIKTRSFDTSELYAPRENTIEPSNPKIARSSWITK